MSNFNRPLPYAAIGSCLQKYEQVYLAAEPKSEDVAKGKTKSVVFEPSVMKNWVNDINASSFKIEFGVYTQQFVNTVKELFPNEPEIANSIKVDRLTTFIVAYNAQNEPIQALNFGDLRP